jgi:Zn-dependent oligopeptidase
MSAAELNEFLTAMEIVRQANAALLDAAHDSVDEDNDLDPSRCLAGLSISPTIH